MVTDITDVTVTVTQSCDLVEYYRNYYKNLVIVLEIYKVDYSVVEILSSSLVSLYIQVSFSSNP